MSYVLNVRHLSTQSVAFSYSLAHEALLSLHVFNEPAHHPLHIQWLIEARKHLTKTTRTEIEAFRFLYGRPIASFWKVDGGHQVYSFEADMTQFLQQPIDDYVSEITVILLGRRLSWNHLESDVAACDSLLQNASKRSERSREVISQFLSDPVQCRQRFADFLVGYWEAVLAKDMHSLQEMMYKDIEKRGRQLYRGGPMEVFEGLSPDVQVNRSDEVVTIRRLSKAHVEFEPTDTVYFVPSYFIYPHLFIQMTKPVIFNYPIEEMLLDSFRPVPEIELLKRFKAMGEPTRMQILQRIAAHPCTTRELAGILGFSEAAVSKHLRILLDAGLVKSRRNSYYVFYEIKEDAFQGLERGIQGALKPMRLNPNHTEV